MATLLRLATAGSVDDGKSTLIGRLLFDSKAVMEDQLASVERTSKERGHDYTDLALLTLGAQAVGDQSQVSVVVSAFLGGALDRGELILHDGL